MVFTKRQQEMNLRAKLYISSKLHRVIREQLKNRNFILSLVIKKHTRTSTHPCFVAGGPATRKGCTCSQNAKYPGWCCSVDCYTGPDPEAPSPERCTRERYKRDRAYKYRSKTVEMSEHNISYQQKWMVPCTVVFLPCFIYQRG